MVWKGIAWRPPKPYGDKDHFTIFVPPEEVRNVKTRLEFLTQSGRLGYYTSYNDTPDDM